MSKTREQRRREKYEDDRKVVLILGSVVVSGLIFMAVVMRAFAQCAL